MRNVRRRLHALERLPKFEPPPSRREQSRSLALRSLSDRDLSLLIVLSREHKAKRPLREFSEDEAAACAAWETALQAKTAQAERTAGQRG
jgi:hypothetical protein